MTELNGEFLRSLIDLENGTVDRRIFTDEDIYRLELERIFARSWNFMCHGSQIPEPGDFILNYIGEDSVIVTRDKHGEPQVLLNTCRHRGNRVCRAEMGRAPSFTCTYHGWTYGLDGTLKGVPHIKDYYNEDLDRDEWGLIKAAKVENYKGFVFATMDPEAPSLEEFLGPVGRLGLSTISAHGDIVVVDGIQKFRVACNWKLAVDNIYDFYHPPITHSSALASDDVGDVPWSDLDHVVSLGEYGHAISGPRLTRKMREEFDKRQGDQKSELTSAETWRDQPKAQEELGEFGTEQRGHPGIFPNVWIASSGTQISLRHPCGPDLTEIWWLTFVDKNMSEEDRKKIIGRANHFFGPGGLFEQDDGENWDLATRACKGIVSQQYPFNVAMDLGHGVIKENGSGIPHIETAVNEHAQRWTYQAWADWMAAKDWARLKQDHSIPKGVM